MKRRINILIPIFLVLLAIYVVRSFVGPVYQTETLLEGSISDMVSTKGIIIRYESVLTPTAEGVFEPLVLEGARVSVGQPLAAVYTGGTDKTLGTRLEQVKKKIAQIEESQASLLNFTGDVSRLEQKIADTTEELVRATEQGDMTKVSQLRFSLDALCEKKAQVQGGGTAGTTLEALKDEKKELEGAIGTAHQTVTAPIPGIFSTTVDGFESEITPYNMTELTPAAIDTLLAQERGQEAKTEGAACKVVKNFRYFVAFTMETERVGTLTEGKSASLRMYDLMAEDIPVTVLYISPEEEGRVTVIVESNRHVESLAKRRFVNLEFIKKHHSGYRVSVKSIRTKGDQTGVYVYRDITPTFIPVEIAYNSQEIAIVQSADSGNPLRLYDKVIIAADGLEEGEILS